MTDKAKDRLAEPTNKVVSEKQKLIIKHNIRSRSIKGYIKEFEENESHRLVRRKDSVQMFHSIISFHPGDRELITDTILKDIAKKFIAERGTNCLYIGAKHAEEHIHLHICSSGTQLNGRSARISKQQFRSIKLAMERYQQEKYPFLRHSIIEHVKGKSKQKEAILSAVKANRQYYKATLLENIQEAFQKSHSKEEFIARLRTLNHEPYFRSGHLQGVLFEGKTKYRFSKLGLDKEQLDRLDEVKKPIQELQSIRNVMQLEKDKTQAQKKEPNPKQVEKNTEDKLLESLRAIRAKRVEKERESGFERNREQEDGNYSQQEVTSLNDSSVFPDTSNLFC